MLWYCSGCLAAYAVGLPACPQCGSTEYTEEPMPKITVHGGPSNASVPTSPEPCEEVTSGRLTPEEHTEVINPVEEPEKAGEPVTDGYDDLTKIELQNELDKRRLTKAGNKEELIERLREDDQKKAGEQPEQED